MKTFKFALGTALIAAAQLVCADDAGVQISNLTIGTSGPQGWGWFWLPGLDDKGNWPDWVAQSAGATVGFNNPSFNDAASGWHGQTLNASLTDAASHAQVSVLGQTISSLSGVAASASVTANGGQSGWAFAKVYDGLVLVGANMGITVSMLVNDIHVAGSMAQANASIEICGTDFTVDNCNPLNYVEAFIDGSSPNYSGPSVLTTSWTNVSSENGWARMRISLTASAESMSAPVPEPATTALWLAGLASVGAVARRRRSR